MRNTINSITYPNGNIYYSALGTEISGTMLAAGSYKLCELFDKNSSGMFKITADNDYIIVEKTPNALFCIEKSTSNSIIESVDMINENLYFTTKASTNNCNFINLSLPVKYYDSELSAVTYDSDDLTLSLPFSNSSIGSSPKIVFGTDGPLLNDNNPIGTIYVQYTQSANEGELT